MSYEESLKDTSLLRTWKQGELLSIKLNDSSRLGVDALPAPAKDQRWKAFLHQQRGPGWANTFPDEDKGFAARRGGRWVWS